MRTSHPETDSDSLWPQLEAKNEDIRDKRKTDITKQMGQF